MENQDIKLFDQFKKVAESQAPKEFSGMETVWNTIETKLDNQVLKKQNKTWKKWAVAASVLLVGSIAYQFLKNDTTAPTVAPAKQDEVVVAKPIVFDSEEIVQENVTKKNKNIVEKPHEVLKKEITASQTADYAAAETAPTVKTEIAPAADESIPLPNKDESYKSYLRNNGNTANTTISNGYVKGDDKYTIVLSEVQKEAKAKAQKPLVVKDGELVNNYDENDTDVELVIELTNPIYIINGVRYSEAELFGDYPTSPYYPLKKQKITSCTVIKPEDAVKAYGPEGVNGVVIISTKDGKPRGK